MQTLRVQIQLMTFFLSSNLPRRLADYDGVPMGSARFPHTIKLAAINGGNILQYGLKHKSNK